jgi:hypothetical protein
MARLAACLLLVSSTILAISPVSGQGIQHGAVLRFSPPRLELGPLKDHIVLSSRDWLGGRGVDVYYDTSRPCNHDKKTITVIDTIAYECVDLAARLYYKVGYNNFRWLDDGKPIGAAKDLVYTDKLQKPSNERLSFYPNDGSADRPPAPGDLLVFKASAQNGYFGHVAVVNWVAGDTLEYVQQNVCPTGPPEPYGWANLKVELDNGKQLFSITDGGSGGSVAGWVHSDLIKQQLIDQPEMRRAGDIRWNRDDTAVYVYLSPARTRAAALGAWGDQDVALLEFADLLKEAGALSFTTYDLAWQIANQVSKWIRSDRRLNPASGVRSVDFTLKYTGRMIWVRPWGGPANGKWIPFVMEDLAYAYAPAWKTPKAGPPE